MARRRESRLGVRFQAELIEALGQPGCGFCRLGRRTVARFLDILGYENVNDIPLRADLRDALGLCNRHAWQFLEETGNILGVAIISRDLIRTLQRRAPTPEGRMGPAERLEPLRPKGRCVACRDLAAITRDSADALVKGWVDPSVRAAFAASDGLCWTHLVTTLRTARSPARRAELIADQRVAWARTGDDADLLREAISSAPRIWGTQIDALPPDLSPIEPDALPTAPEGQCPICAGIQGWQEAAHPRPLPRAGGERREPVPPLCHLHEAGSDFAITSPARTGEGPGVRGLPCAVHAWQERGKHLFPLDTLRQVRGDLEARLAEFVASAPADPPILRWTRRWLPPARLPSEVTDGLDCRLCAEQLRRELGLVASMPPATLCLPHLRLAAARSSAYPEIHARTRATWHTLELHLAEFIRKHDYRFRHEPLTPGEAVAPTWATNLIAGGAGMR